MASVIESTELPSAALRQSNFEQAVAYALHLWPALTLSVQNLWGGPDSADKRDWFAGAVVDLFPGFTDKPVQASASTTKALEEPDLEYVETFLLQVMTDEFEVNVDDETGAEVATQIIKARAQCAQGQFDEYNSLRERFANRKSKKVDQLYKRVEDADQDTDWESDDDEDGDEDDHAEADVQMDEAPRSIASPKEKPVPEVDDEGFTTVARRKR